VNLQVIAACDLVLQIAPVNGGGPGQPLRLTFSPCPGHNHTVETRDSFGGGSWQALSGGPHNSGTLLVTNSAAARFFRVAARPQ
jgi:hypothetical protein